MPGKYPNSFQFFSFNFYFKPLGSRGKFPPQCTMPDEQQSPSHRILHYVSEIRRGHDAAQALLIPGEFWFVKVRFKNFRHDLVF